MAGKSYFVVFLLCTLLNGCSKLTEPKLQDPVPVENKMSLSYDNKPQQSFQIEVAKNGYVKGEVVMYGFGEGFNNTLMLTFKLKENGTTEINRSMTGYWDLGLCIPFNKYLLTDDSGNYIKINSYNERTNAIFGEFNLRFRYEKDTSKTALFSNGKFEAVIDTGWSFKYCIEG